MSHPTRRLIAGIAALVVIVASCSDDGTDASAESTGPGNEAAEAESGPARADGISMADVEASIAELDLIVERAMQETGVPGVAVGVVFDDQVVSTQGYGVRVAGGEGLVDAATVFQIASLSKPISSTVMAGAVGDGIIEWDDPVSDHNTDFELSDPLVTEQVTFADLFAHRSGIPAGGGDVLEAIGYSRDEVLERLRFLPITAFRDAYGYSNFAMTAGGESVAIAAGTSWEDLAETILFEPAGMTDTSMRHADFIAAENRAELHVETDDGWVAAFERMPDAQAPAGGVSSNVTDLSTWLRLQLAGGELDGEPVIDNDALDETHIPHILSGPPAPTIGSPAAFYGLGWNIRTDATGAIRWNHSGAFSTGAATAATLLPNDGLGLVVLTNGSPIGVPEAISDAYLSHLQTGEWSADVFAMWRDRFAGVYGAPAVTGEPPADPAPARDDAVYVGTYTNGFVGDVEVVESANGLALVMGPDDMEFEMTHRDGDMFVYVPAPELPDFLAGVTFDVGPDGVPGSVTITEFDGEGQGTLQRV